MKPWHLAMAKAFALLASFCCACVPIVIRSQGEWTPLKVATACGSVVCAMGLLALAVGPNRWWSRAAQVANGLRTVPVPMPSSRSIAGTRCLIVVSIVVLSCQVGWRLSHPVAPWKGDDQGAFLSTATEISNAGGPRQLLARLWSGEYEEANRHPLYTGLLSLRPTEEFGRILSATFAILAWGAVVALTWLRFGPMQSGIAALLLAVNATWGYFSDMIVCESLLLLLSVLIWWRCLRLCDIEFGIAKNTNAAAGEGVGRTPAVTRWLGPLVLGVLLGLNYLTKGTGVVLLGCVLMWFGLEGVVAIFSTRRKPRIVALVATASLTLFAFLLTSSPLIVRNVKRFQQPFYNINTYLLFADQYEGFRELIARGEPISQVAREYLASHTLADLARREASGLVWESFIIVRMLGPIPLDDARILFGVPIVGLALIGLLRAPPTHRRWLAVWVAVQWLVFAWYVPIAAGDRFVIGVLPPLLVYAADGGVALWNWQHVASISELPVADSHR